MKKRNNVIALPHRPPHPADPETVEIPTFLLQMFERCASDMTEALGLLTKITGVELRPKQTRRSGHE